jgi:arsenate reductase
MITVYHYPACSTCKKAIKWLEAKKIEHKLVHIVDQPPNKATLSRVLKASGLPINKLFNTSGELYRAGNYKEKLATLSEAEALTELAAHGKLIKRPLVIGESKNGPVHLVGFKESDYQSAF